jgi:hypothetical protein
MMFEAYKLHHVGIVIPTFEGTYGFSRRVSRIC